MNMKLVKQFSLILGVLMISSVVMAQKKNETSAAVEYKNNYLKAFMTGDMDAAKKALRSAKEFIDLAAAHPETQDSEKTLWLKGEIYSSYMTVGIMSQDTSFIKEAGEDAIDVAIAAFKKGYPNSKKYKKDYENSVAQKAGQMDQYANMMYQAEMFEEAAEIYHTMYRYFDAINVLDSTSLFNASLCFEKAAPKYASKLAEATNAEDSTIYAEGYERMYTKAAEGYSKLAEVGYKGTSSAVYAARAYQELGEYDKAIEVINMARKNDPTDKSLLLELVNTNIAAGNAEGAEKALTDAIEADPNNKQLFYTIGTIYIDLKKNAEAQESLEKALAIDPDYVDAQYQLGAHLFNWANDIMLEANNLKIGDPRFNELKAQSEEKMNQAVVQLEKYILNDPNNKAILTILYQAHHKAGNTEKALEYKKRAEAAE